MKFFAIALIATVSALRLREVEGGEKMDKMKPDLKMIANKIFDSCNTDKTDDGLSMDEAVTCFEMFVQKCDKIPEADKAAATVEGAKEISENWPGDNVLGRKAFVKEFLDSHKEKKGIPDKVVEELAE